MKVLITGGAGFIGSAACRYLINTTKDEVLNIDKLTYAASGTALRCIEDHDSYSFLKGDIANQELIGKAINRFRPDTIMHFAAESHVDRSISSATPFVDTNIVGTYSLLEAALEYWRELGSHAASKFRFIHVSTDEVYGSLGPSGLFHEETAYDPRSPYSASKAAADHLVSAWHHTYGLPTIISNCSNNYGPFHFPEKLIPLTIINGLLGRKLPVYGDGQNVRDWLYVEDHVRALRLIAEHGTPGQKYNIGGRNERTNLHVMGRICGLLDELSPSAEGRSRQEQICYVADRPGHDRRYAIDASKLENELGWRANETFETGLRKTVQWYIDRRDWWEPLQEKYSGQRLGVLVQPQQAES